MSKPIQRFKKETSWEKNAKAYSALVGEEGSYYHRSVIFPKLLALMQLTEKDAILELGCGQGVFSRQIPKCTYFGLDASPTLIKEAKRLSPTHYFKVQDVTQPFKLTKKEFTHVVIILALQNMADLHSVIANAKAHLHRKGKLWIVINHPAFRIPKATTWLIDEDKQSRVVDAYMTLQKIPIDMTPGGQKSTITWSFHRPLQAYISAFKNQKLVLQDLHEWVSDKKSVGKNAERENKSRAEIPMFMLLVAGL